MMVFTPTITDLVHTEKTSLELETRVRDEHYFAAPLVSEEVFKVPWHQRMAELRRNSNKYSGMKAGTIIGSTV